MPLSKARKKAYDAAHRRARHPHSGGTVLMPKAVVRRLRRLGISPSRYLTTAPVGLEEHWAVKRELAARSQRVEWQSGGIRMLRAEIATLKALLATLPAMQDTEIKQRLIALETQQALHEAEHGPLAVEEPQRTAEQVSEAQEMPFKDFRRFVELHNQAERTNHGR